MALNYPDCFGKYRTKSIEVHAQIERLTLARHNQRKAQEAQHSAQLTAFISDLRDLLEEIEDWAINGKESE